MTERHASDVTGDMRPRWSLRGGPGLDYPCRSPGTISCVRWECQEMQRCVIDHLGERARDAKEG